MHPSAWTRRGLDRALALLLAVLASACDDDGDPSACVTDSDCMPDYVCHTSGPLRPGGRTYEDGWTDEPRGRCVYRPNAAAPDAASQPDGPSVHRDGGTRPPDAPRPDGRDSLGMLPSSINPDCLLRRADVPGSSCDQAGCARARAACCVHSGDCCEAGAEQVVARLNLDMCAAGRCFENAKPFGQPLPSRNGNTLLPGGAASTDAGFALTTPLDTAMAIELRATMATPPACPGPCDELAGIGLMATPSPSPRVRPVVALVVSSQRRQRMLIVDGITVWDEPLESPFNQYRLVLRPTGEAQVYVGARLATVQQVNDGQRRQLFAVVYGRNGTPNALEPERARFADALVLVRSCGSYTQWERPVLLRPDLVGVRAPSIAIGENRRVGMAFERSRKILFEETTNFRAAASTQLSLEVGGSAGASDPEVVWNPETKGWDIYYTGIEESGQRWIGVTHQLPAGGFDRGRPGIRLADLDVDEVDAPSYLRREGPLITELALRVRQDFETRLVLVSLQRQPPGQAVDGGAPPPGGPPALAVVLRGVLVASSAEPGLNSAGIGTGDLVRLENTFQLVYGGRASGVSSVGLRASDDLKAWTPKRVLLSPLPLTILASGVSDPDIADIGGEVVVLFGTGEGDRAQIGLMTRPSTPTPL